MKKSMLDESFVFTMLGVIIAALFGYLITVYIPSYIKNLSFISVSPVFVWLSGQVLLGFLLGYLYPGRWLYMALSTGIFVVAYAIFDVIVNFSERNIWPIEIIFSFVVVLPALAGSYMGMSVKSKQ